LKSSELLKDKFIPLADVFKQDHESKCYLINYAADEIKSFKDYEEWCNFWLIEYIPDTKSNQEPKLEVRSFNSLKEIKTLTVKFNSEYRHFIYALSNSDRTAFEELTEMLEEPIIEEIATEVFRTLTIWETKEKFIDALKSVKEKILIESPWIKRATLDYIPLFERLLKEKKQLIILYGISEKDEHDISTLKKLENCKSNLKIPLNLFICHLTLQHSIQS
jgi:hypothetical protein